MFQKLFNALFGAPSVDADLYQLRRITARLQRTAQHHDDLAAKQQEAADAAAAARAVALSEASRARKVAERFEDFATV